MIRATRRVLAARGSSLSERLTDAYEPVASQPGAALARERLERWRAAIDRGEPGRFKRRLAWDGLDEASVLAKLGEVRLRDGEPVPVWAAFFADALFCPVPEGLLDPKEPLAFEEVVAPFVGAAWERLARARGAARLSAGAVLRLRRDLLRSLCGLCAPVFARDLKIRRSAEVSGFEALLRDPTAAPSRRLYAGLVEEATSPEFWLARAALARALAVAAARWAAALGEMLFRLEADAVGLSRAFAVASGEAVASLDFTASDPHDGGRRVGLFTFASGARVVYKPRGAQLLAAWEEFLAELEALGAPEPYRRRGLLAPGPHAWLEFVPRAPCRDAAEVARYYRRTGHLLALMHVLQARDLHFENVVAAGDFPVPIDLEVILQGDARRLGAGGPMAAGAYAASLLDRSVFATGLLPIWPEDQDDFGALSAGANRTVLQARWKALNTDEMAVEWVATARDSENSRVVCDGRPVDAYVHREELTEGFRAGARFLARVAPQAQKGKEYRALLAAPVRALLRATGVYGKLLSFALQGAADGVDRSLELESLAAAWTQDDASRELWPLGRAELKAMEAFDIPLIHARAQGRYAWSPDGERGPLMLRTGYSASLGAWNALDERGIALQEGILRAAMIGLVAADHAAAASPASPSNKENRRPFDAAWAEALAAEIAADAAKRVAHTPAGAAWIEPAYDSKMNHLKLTVLGSKFYDGTAGLALFLAARSLGSGGPAPGPGGEAARALAREAAAPLLGLGATERRGLARAIGLGGGVGVGGALYALTRAGRFLGDEDFLDAARGLARVIDAPAVAAERQFDVMFGLAGTTLSLLALHDVDPRAEWLERAVLCGERLLAARESWEGGPRAWRGKDAHAPASGFSHGAAGAACALWRLAARAGDARFRDAALEAWAFDDALFVPQTGFWRRTAADDESSGHGWSTWCWGAPGAGLSRLEAAAAGEVSAANGVERALSVVRGFPPRGMDHLCCGEFGVAEFLLESGRALGRPELVAEARARAAARLPEGPGLRFRLHPALPDGPTSPTFFGGTAGIGYGLLRLSQPERYPCVIAWR